MLPSGCLGPVPDPSYLQNRIQNRIRTGSEPDRNRIQNWTGRVQSVGQKFRSRGWTAKQSDIGPSRDHAFVFFGRSVTTANFLRCKFPSSSSLFFSVIRSPSPVFFGANFVLLHRHRHRQRHRQRHGQRHSAVHAHQNNIAVRVLCWDYDVFLIDAVAPLG